MSVGACVCVCMCGLGVHTYNKVKVPEMLIFAFRSVKLVKLVGSCKALSLFNHTYTQTHANLTFCDSYKVSHCLLISLMSHNITHRASETQRFHSVMESKPAGSLLLLCQLVFTVLLADMQLQVIHHQRRVVPSSAD